MKVIELNKDSETLYQSIDSTITTDRGGTRNVRFELRYLGAVNKWYLSMFDKQTGEAYFRYVPVVACSKGFNDLVSPFAYKNIGFVVCMPNVDNTTSEDPQKDNLNQFYLLWGDDYVQ